jgi:hypothetical protein
MNRCLVNDENFIIEKSLHLDENALSSDALKQGELLTSDEVHAYDNAIIGKIDPSIASDVRNINKEQTLGEHLLEWVKQNYDTGVNKQELHMDDNKLKTIYPIAANLIKFQLHSTIFKTEVTFETIADSLQEFENIVTIPGVKCEKIVKQYPRRLSKEDEFRFNISLLQDKPLIKYLLVTSLPASISHKERLKLIDSLLNRTLDVRLIDVTFTSPSVTFTAQTLSNHPYGARRSWRLKMTANPNEYIIETVEANSFPWLIDYFVEKQTGGKDALVLWEKFLKEVIRRNRGLIIDDTLIDGKKTTFYGSLDEVLSNTVVQEKLSEYPLLAEEVNRLR